MPDPSTERRNAMYASIREYRTTDNAEVARRAEEGFLPIVREIAGVSAYYVVDAGDKLFTITLADDQSKVEESVSKAREWVQENAADLLEGSPVVTNG
jgi:hypothetical protein